MALNVQTSDEGGSTVIRADGEVDLYSAPALRDAILKAAKGAQENVCVDLGAVAYMDSSGVATLVEGLKAAGQGGKGFILQKPSQQVMKVLKLSRLDAVFKIQE